MQLTPTDKGSGIAGIALASIAWFSLFKLDDVAKVCRVDRWVSKEPMFAWINKSYSNRALTLLITEIINFSIHGITNPSSVLFACGSTMVNAFMIFVGLPLRQHTVREKAKVL